MRRPPCAGCRETLPDDASFCPWCGVAAESNEATRVMGSPPRRMPSPPRSSSDEARTRLSTARPAAHPAAAGSRRRILAVAGLVLAAGTLLVAALLLSRTRGPAEPVEDEQVIASEPESQDETAAAAKLRSTGDAVASLRELGVQGLRSGDAALAATWLEAAAAAARDRPPGERSELLADAAGARMLSGQPQVAQALLEEALRLSPRCAPALAHRGTLRLAQGDAAAALADLEAACALRPGMTAAQAARAHALLAAGRTAEAAAAAEIALSLEPGSALALHAAASAALAAGDVQRARELSQAADRAAPGRPEIRSLMEASGR